MADRLTLEQRCKIAAWQEVYRSPITVAREFEKVYGHRTAPSRHTIDSIHTKFMETGSVTDKIRSGRPRTTATNENIELLEEAFAQSQGKSIRRAALELNINKSSIQRMLRGTIGLYPYKLQVVHKLQEEDYDSRVEMCESLLHHFQNDNEIMKNLWFSDESIFHLSGRVNRHNCRIWGKSNPSVTLEHERDSPKLVVWCAMSSTGIIGPFFFRDAKGNCANVTGVNYLQMLQEYAIPQLRARGNLDNVFFQQDGAPAHYAIIVRDFLNVTFPDRWVGRRGPLEWAPRSPDLTPCDFFLWGYIKSKVYATKPRNLAELEEKIRTACTQIDEQMLQNVGKECIRRWLKILEIGGSHVEVYN